MNFGLDTERNLGNLVLYFGAVDDVELKLCQGKLPSS